jgi:origin recognition complex subunit 2
MSDNESSGSQTSDGQSFPHTDNDQSRFVHLTSFDAYFQHSAKSAKTSSNVLSNLVPPLTRDEYATAIAPVLERRGVHPSFSYHREFWQYERELQNGFNLLFYGLGSKRDILNQFAHDVCSASGNVVIVNAYTPSFSLRDMISSIENIPEVAKLPASGSSVEAQALRIRHALEEDNVPPLFLVIHNIDAPALRASKAHAVLSLLALSRNIRVVASVDHINAPLLFPTNEAVARKDFGYLGSVKDIPPSRGFAWLWHDLTTLSPYDVELAHTDKGSVAGASAAYVRSKADAVDGSAGNSTGVQISESAAKHVIASVTAKAKKLFMLMARRQLETAAGIGDTTAGGSETRQFAIAYDALFQLCRDEFIATTDGALRALLGEFRDHAMVLSTPQGGAGAREVLWIPLRQERLAKLLQHLDQE